jgi:hypothetical protein
MATQARMRDGCYMALTYGLLRTRKCQVSRFMFEADRFDSRQRSASWKHTFVRSKIAHCLAYMCFADTECHRLTCHFLLCKPFASCDANAGEGGSTCCRGETNRVERWRSLRDALGWAGLVLMGTYLWLCVCVCVFKCVFKCVCVCVCVCIDMCVHIRHVSDSAIVVVEVA